MCVCVCVCVCLSCGPHVWYVDMGYLVVPQVTQVRREEWRHGQAEADSESQSYGSAVKLGS